MRRIAVPVVALRQGVVLCQALEVVARRRAHQCQAREVVVHQAVQAVAEVAALRAVVRLHVDKKGENFAFSARLQVSSRFSVKILAFALKNIQASLILFRSLIHIFAFSLDTSLAANKHPFMH